MPIIAALLGRLAIIQGASVLSTAIFYAVLIAPAIAFYTVSVHTFDALIQSAPLKIMQVYYLCGFNLMLQMFTTALTTGLTARFSSGVFRKVLDKL